MTREEMILAINKRLASESPTSCANCRHLGLNGCHEGHTPTKSQSLPFTYTRNAPVLFICGEFSQRWGKRILPS